MKKIVGILAAATVATSLFAADISAATKIKANLFSYSADKTMGLLNEINDSHDYANPNLSMSVSDEKAGATVKLTTDGGNTGVAMTTQTIWFKPVDMLKVTLGNSDVALNKETIKWTESWTGLGTNGILVTVDVSGFTLDVGFACNGKTGDVSNFWMTKIDGVDDPILAPMFVKGAYAADFGTIGAYVLLNRAPNPWDAFAPAYGIDPKDGAISNMDFGAGYKNTFDPVTVFANVIGHMEDKFEWVRAEVFASGNVDAFGFGAFVAPLIFVNSDLDQDAQVEVLAKVTYALDACTPYACFKDQNILAKKFTSTIEIGATGNCGLMGWNAWVQIDTGKGAEANKVEISVPVEFTVSF